MMMGAVTRRPERTDVHRRGFTLIEMLVVIGVIVLMIGIGMAAYVSVMRSGDAAATRAVLEQAQGAERTYRDAVDLPHDQPIPGADDMRSLLRVLMQHEESRMMLESVGDEHLTGEEGNWRLRDGWNEEIIYVPPGEEKQGYPARQRSYFVSRGRDRDRGTEDDMFSYDR